MQGWDKTYCLQFVEADGFNDIHFFGDKTFEVRCGPAPCRSADVMSNCHRGKKVRFCTEAQHAERKFSCTVLFEVPSLTCLYHGRT